MKTADDYQDGFNDFDVIEVPDVEERVIFDDQVGPKAEPQEPADDGAKGDQADEERQRQERSERAKAREAKKRETSRLRYKEMDRRMHEASERAAAEAVRNEQLAEEIKGLLKERADTIAARRRDALESGNTDEFDRLDAELDEVRYKLRQHGEKPAAPERTERKPAAEPNDMHPAARAWIEENDWMSDEEHAELADKAVQIERRLRKEGTPISMKLYRKLDDELSKLPEYRELMGMEPEQTESAEGEPPAASRPTRTPVARVTDDTPPARPAKGVKFTDYDKQTIRSVGLDPDDPKVRAAYLKRKMG